MYLISIYFDETTDNRIRSYMKQIAKYTGNTLMLDGNIPPHITIAEFQTDSEKKAKGIFERIIKQAAGGSLQWVSVGMFLPHVIYLSPILNEYLCQLSEITYKEMILEENVTLSPYYRPFRWLPHATLSKKLTKEQMRIAFEVMQNQFGPFESGVSKIGLSKTNPYTDLAIFKLEQKM